MRDDYYGMYLTLIFTTGFSSFLAVPNYSNFGEY